MHITIFLKIIAIWMHKIPHMPLCLNDSSPATGTDWEGGYGI